MRRARHVPALSAFALAIACGACGAYGNEATSGTTRVTSGPAVSERELSRSASAVGARLAEEVCAHEAKCGRAEGGGGTCVDDTRSRAQRELLSWECEPAEIRARAEQCLVSMRSEPCTLDLSARRRVCPVVVGCSRNQADLVPPGERLAEFWR